MLATATKYGRIFSLTLLLLFTACASAPPPEDPAGNAAASASVNDVTVVSSSFHIAGPNVTITGRVHNGAAVLARGVVVRGQIKGPRGVVRGARSTTIGRIAAGETKPFSITIGGINQGGISHQAWVSSANF